MSVCPGTQTPSLPHRSHRLLESILLQHYLSIFTSETDLELVSDLVLEQRVVP
jgi:hypothetical protein